MGVGQKWKSGVKIWWPHVKQTCKTKVNCYNLKFAHLVQNKCGKLTDFLFRQSIYFSVTSSVQLFIIPPHRLHGSTTPPPTSTSRSSTVGEIKIEVLVFFSLAPLQNCKKQKLVMTTASDELRALALPVMTRQCHKVKSSSSLSPAS